MKKIISLLCTVIFVLTLFSGCGYRIRLEKVEDESTTVEADISLPSEVSTYETQESTSETTTEETTVDPLEAQGIIVEDSFRAVAMDTKGVIDFYTKAVNNVKNRCPGFKKTEYQDIGEVTAGNGNINLANKILNLVAKELLVSSGDTSSTVTVAAHDDVNVMEQFPVFGESYGCLVDDLSIIKSASCLTNGKQYKIVITFNDQLNPEPKKCTFGNIMTPIERQNVADGIEEYAVVIDSDAFKFDFNYTDCEIICYIDASTGRIISLSQKMIIDIDIDLDIDVIIFKTNIVKATGRLVNHLEYTDFDWS